jgi:hypothetical protein
MQSRPQKISTSLQLAWHIVQLPDVIGMPCRMHQMIPDCLRVLSDVAAVNDTSAFTDSRLGGTASQQ